MRSTLRNSRTFLILHLLAISVVTTGSASAEDTQHFIEVVQPLLRSKCISCHGPEKQEGGLRLDSRLAAMKGGERGSAIVPKNIADSLLIRAISFEDPDFQMPPKLKLADHEIESLGAWIKDGAFWPDTAEMSLSQSSNPGEVIGDAFTDPRNPIRRLFHGDRLDLWSLRKPIISELLVRADDQDDRTIELHGFETQIDRYVATQLAENGLKLSPRADRRSLIRRLTTDLTGLPPTPEEVAAFIENQDPDGWRKLVDRLLASPRYGERQARMWLDVVRYADTHGYERDEFRPLAWQYRDYVIRAFNNDKPFDQFVQEQLAGDELLAQQRGANGRPQDADEADMLIATGYLRLGQWDSTASIFQEEDRLQAEIQADLTNTTASAFLGLTMSCCQCHDHKYDPFSQADHFRLRAFFAGVEPHDDLLIELAADDDANYKLNAELDQQIERLRAEQEKLNKAEESDKPQFDEVEQQIAGLSERKRSPRLAMGATDSDASPPVTRVFYQGDFQSPREPVEPGFVSVLLPGPAALDPPHDATTGRRLALANWITSPDNLWTARVIVNRIWQQHFGTGLVSTPNDFGYSGSPPVYPELLDTLAVAFEQNGWSIKELHRAIVLTEVYCQSSAATPANMAAAAQIDPDNTLLWRQNVRRLDAETLRDSLLAVSGLLKSSDGGRPKWPDVPEEMRKAQPAILEAEKGDDGGRMQGWYTDPIEDTDVRSVYLIRKRCLAIPFLQTFDLPDSTVSCARRDSTVVAPQALMLLNSPAAVRFVDALADRLVGDTEELSWADSTRSEFLVDKLFRLALLRPPESDERQLAIELLAGHTMEHRSTDSDVPPEQRALRDLCRAVLNVNEFVYVD